MIKAIIFDCFGVLRPDVLHRAYQELGGDPAADNDFIADTLYASHTGRIDSSAPVFAERLGVTVDAWLQAITTDANDQQLLDYIENLRGRYKVGVLSNVGKDGLLRYFSQADLDRYFDAVVVSGVIGYAKPQAQAYEIAADRLGVRVDECVFTDDKQSYCEGAQGSGMHAILYKSFSQFKAELESLLADA
ncbi:MAG: HAD-IA family hydrolase [Candidatus Saccharibacteria bacterium]